MNEYRIDKFLWRAEVEEVWGVDPAVCDRSWPWHGCVGRFWWGRDCGPVWFLLRTRVWSSWSCWPKCGRNLCCQKWIKLKISLNFDSIENFDGRFPLFPTFVSSRNRVAVQCGTEWHWFGYTRPVEPQSSVAGEDGNLAHVGGHDGVSSGDWQFSRFGKNDTRLRVDPGTFRSRPASRFGNRRRSWPCGDGWWPWSCGCWWSGSCCSCWRFTFFNGPFLLGSSCCFLVGLVFVDRDRWLDGVGFRNVQVVQREDAGVFDWIIVVRLFGFQAIEIGFDGIRDAINDSWLNKQEMNIRLIQICQWNAVPITCRRESDAE